jgi:ribonucleotide reductase alpha subunit
MPDRFHNMLFLLFSHCYKQQSKPSSWKNSNTILLYKKGHPFHLFNNRPIALANTIYKLFTSIHTTMLSSYGEKYQILHNSQEGFCQERCTSRQIQTLIAALEDAQFTTQDIYLLFIDFTNAFGSIDHAQFLAIMFDLGYPKDAITLVGFIYSQSYITFTGPYFGQTQPIPMGICTLRWLTNDFLKSPFSSYFSSISSSFALGVVKL